MRTYHSGLSVKPFLFSDISSQMMYAEAKMLRTIQKIRIDRFCTDHITLALTHFSETDQFKFHF